MVLGKTKTLISGKSIIRTVPKGQRYITEGTHEAIVSREEFEKAQLVIKSNSHKVLMGSVDFPLKGKVRCGNCRRVMAHNFKQVVPTFWCREGLELVGQTRCTSEIFQVSDIESAVFQALKKELSLLDSLYGDHCSAWFFYLLGSVLLATAILSYLMHQSQGMEALQMLIGGFVIFMIPQVVGGVVVLLELAAVMLRQVWYI